MFLHIRENLTRMVRRYELGFAAVHYELQRQAERTLARYRGELLGERPTVRSVCNDVRMIVSVRCHRPGFREANRLWTPRARGIGDSLELRFEGQERPLRVLKRTSSMTVTGSSFFASPDQGRQRMLALVEVPAESAGQMELWSLPDELAPAEYERFLLWDFDDTTLTSVMLVAAGDFDADRQPRLIYDEVPLPQPRPWLGYQVADQEDDNDQSRYQEWLDYQEGDGQGDPA